MRIALTVVVLCAAACAISPAVAKDRAYFLRGQYATEADCAKLREIEAGGPRNVETAAELLDAEGIHGWEGSCEFTKVLDHDPGKSWVGLMVCSEGIQTTAQNYVFMKNEDADSFDVAAANAESPDTYIRCDAKKER
jgi:hypothetical protein